MCIVVAPQPSPNFFSPKCPFYQVDSRTRDLILSFGRQGWVGLRCPAQWRPSFIGALRDDTLSYKSSCQVLSCNILFRYPSHCIDTGPLAHAIRVHELRDLSNTMSWFTREALFSVPHWISLSYVRDTVWAIFTEDFNDRYLDYYHIPYNGNRKKDHASPSLSNWSTSESVFLTLAGEGTLLDSENLLLVSNLGHSWDNDSFQKVPASWICPLSIVRSLRLLCLSWTALVVKTWIPRLLAMSM